MRLTSLLSAIVLIATFGTSLSAQWLTVRTPGIPRNADGTPNLRAPAPRTPEGKPDLSGLWRAVDGRFNRNITEGGGVKAPFTPWAAALYKERQDNNFLERPSGQCLPKGVPGGITLPGYPFKIVQTPNVTLVLHEIFVDYRQIHTDGRPLPTERLPQWFGYSVGRWEGDTLVVESVGHNERTWFDDGGHPHSEELKITERVRRIDFGRMEIQFTFDDPKAYTQPWSVTMPFELMPDTELLEYVCENERDAPHMIGK